MRDEISIQAVKAAQQVFETMFFVTVEVDGNGVEDQALESRPPSSWIGAEIGFEGRWSGQMAFLIPVELARTMVSNFLGLEGEEPTLLQAWDVVGELCNMVCGNLFSNLDRKEACLLTSPKVWESPDPILTWGEGMRRISIPFVVDGYPVKLEIQFTKPFGSGGDGNHGPIKDQSPHRR